MGGFIPFASASEIKPQELNRSTFNDLMKSSEFSQQNDQFRD